MDIPCAKHQHRHCHTDLLREKDQWRFKIKPIFAKRPEQNDSDQKCRDIGNEKPAYLIVFHFLFFDGSPHRQRTEYRDEVLRFLDSAETCFRHKERNQPIEVVSDLFETDIS